MATCLVWLGNASYIFLFYWLVLHHKRNRYRFEFLTIVKICAVLMIGPFGWQLSAKTPFYMCCRVPSLSVDKQVCDSRQFCDCVFPTLAVLTLESTMF